MTVDFDTWAREAGERIPQTSSPTTIDAMIRLLDVQPGQSVLEIGTGSGYSTALLAQAVGPTGRVDSVDIEANLVRRAQRMHRQAGHDHVHIHHGDGEHGWTGSGPYERVISWATPHRLPWAWVDQSTPDGVLVSSIKLAPVALANGVLRCELSTRRPSRSNLHPGSMIELHPENLVDFRLPVRYVAASTVTTSGPHWLSGAALSDDPAAAQHLLRTLTPETALTSGNHSLRQALPAWLVATEPAHIATAGDPDDWGAGLATTSSAAILRPDGTLCTAGTDETAQRLQGALDAWEGAGRPGFECIAADLRPVADGWNVHARLATP